MAHRYFQGKYRPKNPQKYTNKKGLSKIVYRSSWEKAVMLYLDKSSQVKSWNSEEVVVPYISRKDNKQHRYFIDFYIELESGRKLLVEVKPFKQTQKPKPSGKTPKQKKRFINEVQTYAVNISKWEYAKKYAEKRGMEFVVWTENELERMGIPTKTSARFKAITKKNKIS